MTTQTPPNSPNGAPPPAPSDPAAGLMHEQTCNEALAQALRQRRQLWRTDPNSVLAERLRTLADATRERPDILVAPPDIYPVIIEVEFDEPAFADARRKLGRLVVGTADRVRAAIAVGVPEEVRGWSTDQPPGTAGAARRRCLAPGRPLRRPVGNRRRRQRMA